MSSGRKPIGTFCKLCGSHKTELIEIINVKPQVEVDYHIPKDKYQRSVYHCENCKVYFNNHNLICFDTFYSGDYNNSIDQTGLHERFNKIINLPKPESDNHVRVLRILKRLQNDKINATKINVLDVGSGTCVFLNELKSHVGKTYCIDPDLSAVSHAREVVGVTGAHHGSIDNFTSKEHFELITFNKVLEHVPDPIRNLKLAATFLSEDGLIYVELPESDRIVSAGKIRERAEFAIEHLTVFNQQSLFYLSHTAGFDLQESDVITDPSGKYTIYGFLRKSKG